MYMYMYMYIYIYIERERLPEYGWKPHRVVLAANDNITGLTLLAYIYIYIYIYMYIYTEGYGFIEFEISNSTVSTVFHQPLILQHHAMQSIQRDTQSRCPITCARPASCGAWMKLFSQLVRLPVAGWGMRPTLRGRVHRGRIGATQRDPTPRNQIQ